MLLREHITTAAAVLAAARDGAGFDEAEARWYDNADRIATFLAEANPRHWPRSEMRQMMREHLDLTLEEAAARLAGDVDGDIAAFDRIHTQILHMADMLSEGIIKQFPDHFDALLPATATEGVSDSSGFPVALAVAGFVLLIAASWLVRPGRAISASNRH